ncbi:MAG: type II secretion system GspH family protein [Candidatus Gastranaerophilales bacterium]|nr:type II secretion system GspH family protein [Candidatus Gastranaerophilales bacterium]
MKKAFTLSEVLITLVIIGVIATLTIPALMSNSREQETLVKLKKVYSTMTNAVRIAEVKKGCSIGSWYNATSKNSAEEFFNNYLKPYLQVLKVCTNYSDCGYEKSSPWSTLAGTDVNWHIMDSPTTRKFFYLADGVFIGVRTGDYGGENGTAQYGSNIKFIIDLNGPKEPNTYGQDVFYMTGVSKKGLVPFCYKYTTTQVDNDCKEGGNGECCLQKIINDGWTFSSDYPL